MHMRMVVQPAVVGMQHRHRTGGALQFFVIQTEGVDGFPCVTGDQVVHHALMLPCQRGRVDKLASSAINLDKKSKKEKFSQKEGGVMSVKKICQQPESS